MSGFPGGSDGNESERCNVTCLQCGRLGFDPWVGKIPWRRALQPSPVFLPGELHGQRSLVGYCLNRVEKSRTQLKRLSMHIQRLLTRFRTLGFPGGSDGKESAHNGGDLGSIPGLGRSPGEGNGYPLWYSCLENFMDRGAWQATVHGVAKSRTQMSDFHFS